MCYIIYIMRDAIYIIWFMSCDILCVLWFNMCLVMCFMILYLYVLCDSRRVFDMVQVTRYMIHFISVKCLNNCRSYASCEKFQKNEITILEWMSTKLQTDRLYSFHKHLDCCWQHGVSENDCCCDLACSENDCCCDLAWSKSDCCCGLASSESDCCYGLAWSMWEWLLLWSSLDWKLLLLWSSLE